MVCFHYLALITDHAHNIFSIFGSVAVVRWFATRHSGFRAKPHYTVAYAGTSQNLFYGKNAIAL